MVQVLVHSPVNADETEKGDKLGVQYAHEDGSQQCLIRFVAHTTWWQTHDGS